MTIKNKIITLAYLALFCVGFMENSRGAYYLDFISLFKVSNSYGSLLFSISSLASFMATILSKFWLYRLSSLKATKVALFFLVTSSFLFYFITINHLNFSLFLLINIVYGFGIGILSITLNNLVCENTNITKRSRYLSGLHSMYGLSSLVAPNVVSGLFLANLDWRYIFIFLGGISLVIFLISFVIDKSKEHDLKNDLLLIADKRLYYLIGTAGSLYVASEILLSTRLVLYLVDIYKMDKVSASYFLTLFFVFLFIGRLLTSFVDFKMCKLKLLKISLFTSIITIIVGINIYPPVLVVTALTMSYFFPFYMGFISENYSEYQKDLIAKLMNFIGAALFISHALFGVISDTYGLNIAIYLPVLFLAISLYILHSALPNQQDFVKK